MTTKVIIPAMLTYSVVCGLLDQTVEARCIIVLQKMSWKFSETMWHMAT